MPKLIDHIDAIARKKERGVLFLEFDPEINFDDFEHPRYRYEEDKVRDEIIENLDKIEISWMKCGHFASTNFICFYRSQIYLDVPYDENLSEYKALQTYLEYPDGSIRFCYLPLEVAMKNAHHEESGFWEGFDL